MVSVIAREDRPRCGTLPTARRMGELVDELRLRLGQGRRIGLLVQRCLSRTVHAGAGAAGNGAPVSAMDQESAMLL
jgi:hypothetical protein